MEMVEGRHSEALCSLPMFELKNLQTVPKCDAVFTSYQSAAALSVQLVQ